MFKRTSCVYGGVLILTLVCACQNPDGRWFAPVENISAVPKSGAAGQAINLNGVEVSPANATDTIITWELVDPGETGVTEIVNGILIPENEGTLVVRAVIQNGNGQGEPYVKEFSITVSLVSDPAIFVPVRGIRNVPATRRTGTAIDLNDIAAVYPANATNKTLEWELVDPGTTGAEGIVNGIVTPQNDGYLTIRATVLNGTAQGTPFTADFTIECLSHEPFKGFGMFIVGESLTRLFADSQPGLENVDSLQMALIWLDDNAASNTHYLIELETDQSLHKTTIGCLEKNNITISIVGKDMERKVFYDGTAVVHGDRASTALLTVTGSVTLNIGNNITFDGKDAEFPSVSFTDILALEKGRLVMEAGSKITRFNATGSVVRINGGAFTLKEGGEISGNTFSSGAVYVAGGSFEMRGRISGNTAASVPVDGSCGISAVRLADGATEMFNTALITGNPSINGVHVSGGIFNLYGGEISHNAVTVEGTYIRTGLVVSGGKFTMVGGRILDNGAAPGSAIAVLVGRFDTLSVLSESLLPVVTLNGEVTIRGSILSSGSGGYFLPGSTIMCPPIPPEIRIGPLFSNTTGPIPLDLGWNHYVFLGSRWNDKQLITPVDGLSALDPALFPVGKLYSTGPGVTTGTIFFGEVALDKQGIAYYQLENTGKVSAVPIE
jgi:hypothetical protein